ncbi:hypothetical protein LSH36_496g02069 [Paralvinella palmiformis]|uniref:Hint domain-containing protein n=1 Tax=Paralvinella palmiformis TaxID=53620 RepID=A0AAD9J9K3_9ANNE|nr:hypothetical protein LSH36_496g02069 [Paralvinella palmiformis]
MRGEHILCLTYFVIQFLECDGRHTESWRQREKYGKYIDVIDMNDVGHDKRSSSPDLNRMKRCRCFCRRKWERQFHCCECAQSGCFPGSAHVTLADGKVIEIGDLEPGQKLLTANKDGRIYSDTVLGYLDRRNDIIGRYRKVVTSSGEQLMLSRSHVIYVSANNNTNDVTPRYAQDITIGDYVLIAKDSHLVSTLVINITSHHMQGAFVPLTQSGTLLVDNVLTSCYASFPHGISHAAMAPFRWFPQFADLTPANGVHPYVDVMKKVGRFLLPDSALSSIRMAP